jgi:release factor glutamine methyltransferase
MKQPLSEGGAATLRELLSTVEEAMPEAATARLDALILVEQAFRVDRALLLAELRTPLAVLAGGDATTALRRLDEMVPRRREGTPIAYITGSKEFFSRDFAVGPGVLIPRPETEHLVEAALELLRNEPDALVHDCCCGSGCIGISVAAERGTAGQSTRLLLSDRSPAARHWATVNAGALLGTPSHPGSLTQRVAWRVAAADLLTIEAADTPDVGDARDAVGTPDVPDVPGSDGTSAPPEWSSFDVVTVVTANPPYLTTRETADALSRGWEEPVMALDGGADGLAPYRRLATEAYQALKPGGWVLIEHGSSQAAAVRELLRDAGFRDIETVSDLAGLPRLVKARRGAEDGK